MNILEITANFPRGGVNLPLPPQDRVKVSRTIYDLSLILPILHPVCGQHDLSCCPVPQSACVSARVQPFHSYDTRGSLLSCSVSTLPLDFYLPPIISCGKRIALACLSVCLAVHPFHSMSYDSHGCLLSCPYYFTPW